MLPYFSLSLSNSFLISFIIWKWFMLFSIRRFIFKNWNNQFNINLYINQLKFLCYIVSWIFKNWCNSVSILYHVYFVSVLVLPSWITFQQKGTCIYAKKCWFMPYYTDMSIHPSVYRKNQKRNWMLWLVNDASKY